MLPDIAACLEALADDMGGTLALREKHLERCTVVAQKKAYPERRVEEPQVPDPLVVPVGNVDALMHTTGTHDSLIAVELKWCYVDKPFEAIWIFQDGVAVNDKRRGGISSHRRDSESGLAASEESCSTTGSMHRPNSARYVSMGQETPGVGRSPLGRS